MVGQRTQLRGCTAGSSKAGAQVQPNPGARGLSLHCPCKGSATLQPSVLLSLRPIPQRRLWQGHGAATPLQAVLTMRGEPRRQLQTLHPATRRLALRPEPCPTSLCLSVTVPLPPLGNTHKETRQGQAQCTRRCPVLNHRHWVAMPRPQAQALGLSSPESFMAVCLSLPLPFRLAFSPPYHRNQV